MKKILRVCKTMSLLALGISGFAQETGRNAKLGTLGSIQITDDWVRDVQTIEPDFHFSHDQEVFQQLIDKLFLKNLWYAELAKTSQLDTIEAIQSQITHLQSLIENKVLAEYFLNKKKESIVASEAEARIYYDNNLNQFLKQGYTSFFYCQIQDTLPETVRMAHESARKKFNLSSEEKANSKISNQNLIVSYEAKRMLDKNEPLYKVIEKTDVGKWSSPTKIINGEGYSIYYVESFVPPTAKPFDEVESHCKEMAASLKWNEFLNQEAAKYMEEFPLELEETLK